MQDRGYHYLLETLLYSWARPVWGYTRLMSPVLGHAAARRMSEPENRWTARFREVSPDHKSEFAVRGLPGRYFFPHHVYYLPKCGPDALKLGRRMCGETRLDRHWEVVLYAHPSLSGQFPQELFFDDDIIWHRQQLGKPGHIAFAYLVVKDGNLYGLNYVSDLVQRISRRRNYKTRVEKMFRGWHHLLLNSVVNFALEHKLKKVYSPTAAFVMTQTDPKRTVQKELFERVYDGAVHQRFSATKEGNWWVIDVSDNRAQLVVPEKGEEVLGDEKTICVCHDIERGLGHLRVDGHRAHLGNHMARDVLTGMLRCEDTAGIKATYNVLGCLFAEVRAEIERGGHCLAFHSYDHRIHRWWPVIKHYYRVRRLLASLCGGDGIERYIDQLSRCRLVDKRVRGFRPPRSRLTAEWNDYNLVLRNFDWCATSARQVGRARPIMHNRLVKIPVHFDDFPLYCRDTSFAEWEKQAMVTIERNPFTVFDLHDCYADFWLPQYPAFLKEIESLGTCKTLDQVAHEVLFAHSL